MTSNNTWAAVLEPSYAVLGALAQPLVNSVLHQPGQKPYKLYFWYLFYKRYIFMDKNNLDIA